MSIIDKNYFNASWHAWEHDEFCMTQQNCTISVSNQNFGTTWDFNPCS